MGSIANLFDTDIRKVDTEKNVFFCPECLDCVAAIFQSVNVSFLT